MLLGIEHPGKYFKVTVLFKHYVSPSHCWVMFLSGSEGIVWCGLRRVKGKGKVRGKDMLPGIEHPGKHSKATVLFKHYVSPSHCRVVSPPGIKPRSVAFEGKRSTN
jgi:hypothetical protein